MQQALSRAGRALTHLLTRAGCCEYNLPGVRQLQHLIEAQRYTPAVEHSVMLLVCDIKEMYTGMQHAACLEAVHRLIEDRKARCGS